MIDHRWNHISWGQTNQFGSCIIEGYGRAMRLSGELPPPAVTQSAHKPAIPSSRLTRGGQEAIPPHRIDTSMSLTRLEE